MFDGFWQFAGEHPFIAWGMAWAVWVIPAIVAAPFRYPFLAWNRYLRHKNIAASGWPTAPLMDADGDIVHPERET